MRSYYVGANPALLQHVIAQSRKRGIPLARLWREGIPRPSSALKIAEPELAAAIADHLLAFDFAYLWLQEVALLGLTHIGSRLIDITDQDRARSMIAWRMVGDLAAVRTLVLRGFDVQAKALVRGISENLDALGLASIDVNFCREFIEKQDTDVSHKVWFRWIAKGRARERVEKFVSTAVGADVHDEYRDQEKRLLSAAAHPTFITGLFSLFPHYGYRTSEGENGPNSSISPHSVRTLSYCNYRVLQHQSWDLVALHWVDELTQRIGQKAVELEMSGTSMASRGREIGIILARYFLDFSHRYELKWDDESSTSEVL